MGSAAEKCLPCHPEITSLNPDEKYTFKYMAHNIHSTPLPKHIHLYEIFGIFHKWQWH